MDAVTADMVDVLMGDEDDEPAPASAAAAAASRPSCALRPSLSLRATLIWNETRSKLLAIICMYVNLF